MSSIVKSRGLFLSLLISNCIILLFSLITATVDYLGYRQSTAKYTQDYNHILLSQISDVVDERLQSAHQLIQNIASNPAIDRLRNTETIYDQYGRINSVFAMKALESYAMVYNYVDSIYIYFQTEDAVITSASFYKDTDSFITYSEHAYWSKEQWSSLFKDIRYVSYSNLESLSGGQHRLFSIVSPLSSVGSQNKIYILLNLDYRFLEQFNSQTDIFPQSLLVALSPDKQTMFSLGNTAYLNTDWYHTLDYASKTFSYQGNTLSVANIKSERYDWEYYILMPHDLFLSKPTNIYLISSVVLIFITGIMFSVLSAKKTFRPIRNIVQKFGSRPEFDILSAQGRNELDLIDQVLTKSLDEYKDLQQTLTAQIPIIQMHYVSSFFYGGTDSEESSVHQRFSEVGINFPYKYYCAVIFHFDFSPFDEKENNLQIAYFQSSLAAFKCQDSCIYSSDIDTNNNISAIFNMDSAASIADFEKIIAKKAADLNLCGVTLTTAISELTGEIKKVSSLYASAVRALQARLIQFQGGIVHTNSINYSNYLYYPQELETRLINCVKLGKKSDVHNIIDTVIIENFSDDEISPETSRCLMFSMMSTAFRIINSLDSAVLSGESLDMNSLQQEIQQCTNLQQMEVSLRRIYTGLCDQINSAKAVKSAANIEKILAYIVSNIENPNLSLISAADFAGINPTYLSTYFKEHTGHNFQTYINDLRLTRSLELLKSGNINIQDIAGKVGYTSSGGYIRNFKKKYGITPGQYRENLL